MSGRGSSKRRGPRSAADRVRGLLIMLPWLIQRGRVTVSDMAAQFDMDEADLIADIELAATCGVPPYSPLELTDLLIDDGCIEVGVNLHFDRRMELSASEAFGLSLLAAAAEDMPGFKKKKELKSALKKLDKVLGEGLLDVDTEESDFLELVSRAANTGERLRITYFTPASGERKERTIVVRSVFADRGHWYLTADDDLSGQVRHFRLDRVESAEGTDEFVEVAPVDNEIPQWFSDRAGADTVTLDLDASAAWVAETYPCTVVEERVDGSTRITLIVTSEHWLGRLLLRAGDSVKVVGPPGAADLRERVARGVLELYRSNSFRN